MQLVLRMPRVRAAPPPSPVLAPAPNQGAGKAAGDTALGVDGIELREQSHEEALLSTIGAPSITLPHLLCHSCSLNTAGKSSNASAHSQAIPSSLQDTAKTSSCEVFVAWGDGHALYSQNDQASLQWPGSTAAEKNSWLAR